MKGLSSVKMKKFLNSQIPSREKNKTNGKIPKFLDSLEIKERKDSPEIKNIKE